MAPLVLEIMGIGGTLLVGVVASIYRLIASYNAFDMVASKLPHKELEELRRRLIEVGADEATLAKLTALVDQAKASGAQKQIVSEGLTQGSISGRRYAAERLLGANERESVAPNSLSA